jgi:hypothetical protein
MNWIDLAQDRDQWRGLVNTVMKLQVPQNAGKFLSSCTTGGFSRRFRYRKLLLLCVDSPSDGLKAVTNDYKIKSSNRKFFRARAGIISW